MILILSSIILFTGCNSSENVSDTLPSSSDFNENEITMPIITISRENIPVVKAVSELLIKNSTSDAILRGNVKADFFNENGQHISQLTSDSAHIDQRTNNLHAYGNVKVISDDGVKLFSNSILWDNHYKLITSHDSVMFTSSNNDTMYGIGFESDMDLTQWKIKKPRGIKNIRND